MEHSEFHIGLEFWSGDKRWRCTDVGTRVIVALSLEPHEVVTVDKLGPSVAGPPKKTRYITDDPSWLNGPPYAVAESVFDEYDLGGCSLEQEDELDADACPRCGKAHGNNPDHLRECRATRSAADGRPVHDPVPSPESPFPPVFSCVDRRRL